MANRVFNFDIDKGIAIADSKTKSQVGATFANPVDLLNCGTDDYIEVNQASNLIYPTVNCGPPQAYLSLSVSGIVYNSSFTQFSGATFTGPQWPVNISNMIDYLIGNIYLPADILGDAVKYDSALASPTVDTPWTLKQASWLAEDGDYEYRLSVPNKKPILDNCGLLLGNFSGSSVQVQVKDEFCKPILVGVLSVKLGIRTAAFTQEQAATAAKTLNDYMSIQASAIQGKVPTPYVGPRETVDAWRADHPIPLTQVTLIDNL